MPECVTLYDYWLYTMIFYGIEYTTEKAIANCIILQKVMGKTQFNFTHFI
ncbi:hypothetical protein [Nostoc sp. C052]|nr:hypothetical protein [Nostoc sp. C052]